MIVGFYVRDVSSGLIYLDYGNGLRCIFNPATGKQMNNDIDIHWHDNRLGLYATIAFGFCVSSQEFKMTTRDPNRFIQSRFEEIEEVPIPKIKDPDVYKFYDCHLGVLGGCLSLSNCSRHLNGVDIWITKDYNVKDSWTKLYSAICLPVLYPWATVYAKPLCYRKNGELLLLVFCILRSYLLSYDPESRNSRAVEIAGIDRYIYASPKGKVKLEFLIRVSIQLYTTESEIKRDLPKKAKMDNKMSIDEMLKKYMELNKLIDENRASEVDKEECDELKKLMMEAEHKNHVAKIAEWDKLRENKKRMAEMRKECIAHSFYAYMECVTRKAKRLGIIARGQGFAPKHVLHVLIKEALEYYEGDQKNEYKIIEYQLDLALDNLKVKTPTGMCNEYNSRGGVKTDWSLFISLSNIDFALL
ncbi:hypothetical protein GIB67_040562 [Kingdonia uniflora]|uniref:F-box associated domain-containing protein n=1 Tax=Kingdonia uniflora TaxID=39325 RepID=A0A7J7L5L2_9MAGN|nr:hypothetical protein GIB67_040562 [Kingdonia uniflora]